MSNVISFGTREIVQPSQAEEEKAEALEPVAHLVKTLEEWLEKAKAGVLRSAVMITIDETCTRHNYTVVTGAGFRPFTYLGLMDLVKENILNIVEQSVEYADSQVEYDPEGDAHEPA